MQNNSHLLDYSYLAMMKIFPYQKTTARRKSSQIRPFPATEHEVNRTPVRSTSCYIQKSPHLLDYAYLNMAGIHQHQHRSTVIPDPRRRTANTDMNDIKSFLNKYLSLELALIPIRQSTKTPLVKWKSFTESAPSSDQVYEWFKTFPTAGIAALMGRVSGNILAVDVDFRNGGENSMNNLELPETFTSRTGGGGYHFLYHSQFTGHNKIDILPGIDIIAEGGYCVMPPSLHNTGARYEILKDLPIGPAPDWLTTLSAQTGHKNLSPVHTLVIPVGRRHKYITRSVLGYASETFYLTHLWKRAYALAVKCCELPAKDPFTIGELFGICLWAWNRTHPHDPFSYGTAWKLLAGSAKRRCDIPFGPASATLHPSFLLTSQRRNNSTTQTSQAVSDTGTY